MGEGQKSPHGVLPGGVTALGGQTERFLAFLRGWSKKRLRYADKNKIAGCKTKDKRKLQSFRKESRHG
ncbi:MAG: hypothetical protein RR194_07580, partial [Ruthenibacterium sp.]